MTLYPCLRVGKEGGGRGKNKKVKNIEIKNLKEFKSTKDNFIFHAGTKSSGNKIVAVGGRVINFVNISDSYLSSRKEIINQIKKLNWENGFYRKDIGHKVVDQ